jgi:hypothetical protein
MIVQENRQARLFAHVFSSTTKMTVVRTEMRGTNLVVYNERDSTIRFDSQDGLGNVVDLRGSQRVNQGPNEDLPACS